MNAADVVAYAFDGAVYCLDHVPQAHETDCTCGEADENGACMNNCHGYGPNPVFAGDIDSSESCDVDGCGLLEGEERK